MENQGKPKKQDNKKNDEVSGLMNIFKLARS